VDRVIALKFPAYLVPHPSKKLWLLHQFRQAYDLYESGISHLCGSAYGQQVRSAVQEADRQAFLSCVKIFTGSPVTQRRLKHFNGFDSEVLHPPLTDPERFVGGEYGNYFFAGGRIGPGKRQVLLIEAMRYVRSDSRLIIAGPPDEEDIADTLQSLVDEWQLAGRVELRFGFRPREEIATLVNGALACAYLPIDEDCFGYVTMEAFAAGKPVLTTKDAGAVLGIVLHGETGLILDPDPRAIAAGLDELAQARSRTARLGAAAREILHSKQLTWTSTIDRLLA
jgi:glycosyltransferase involved in cell wall biosynthesis